MRPFLFACVFLAMFNGCASQDLSTTNAAFLPYVDSFLSDMDSYSTRYNRQNVRIPIMIFDDELGLNVGGKCYPGDSYKIRINPYHWSRLREIEKKALIYHELGHCALLRLYHDDSMYINGCAVSIMASEMWLYNRCLDNKWEHYMKELFND